MKLVGASSESPRGACCSESGSRWPSAFPCAGCSMLWPGGSSREGWPLLSSHRGARRPGGEGRARGPSCSESHAPSWVAEFCVHEGAGRRGSCLVHLVEPETAVSELNDGTKSGDLRGYRGWGLLSPERETLGDMSADALRFGGLEQTRSPPTREGSCKPCPAPGLQVPAPKESGAGGYPVGISSSSLNPNPAPRGVCARVSVHTSVWFPLSPRCAGTYFLT